MTDYERGRLAGLREAAGIARSEAWKPKAMELIRQGKIPCVYELVAETILASSEQRVCEWDKLPTQIGGGYMTCMEVVKDTPMAGDPCPYCGKPIKIKGE